MRELLTKANSFFDISLNGKSRIAVLLGGLLLVPALALPLWSLTLVSNQFPEGLVLKIYGHKLEGVKTQNRDDLKEINALNHYIGMQPLREEDFTEFKWIPFVIGGTLLLALRAVVLGKMSKLTDLLVLFSYFGLFSLWSFYDKLYMYGHDLDPTAAVKVDPFTPPMFGHQTMANFEVYSYPSIGSLFMVLVPILLLAAVWLSRKERIE